ncbi:uncharacterized protein LOC107799345 isoform X2 [Nicotiana tabacum]|uniref:Uncharacterized protein LOC107799345 isoform X2 n=1 Tax=Nicotiana tabacum TaxID=4097 RepID=A0A1S4AMR8_TOBAC|nr:uncharacterized protein LOC104120425 isoform X2 [Nicotiana tomentosiformis]XP_016477934.1 PREDICTED: uncharacterized protein LOC107799345 isoform X2 [Nicotiana tabacum]
MQLKDRLFRFPKIKHHANMTQYLCSIRGIVWYIGVSKPSNVDPADIKGAVGAEIAQSHCGHFHVLPAVDELAGFQTFRSKVYKAELLWHAEIIVRLELSVSSAICLDILCCVLTVIKSQLTLNKLCNLQTDTIKLRIDNIAKVVLAYKTLFDW